MKEDKLPSYVKLLDYYKRTKTDGHLYTTLHRAVGHNF